MADDELADRAGAWWRERPAAAAALVGTLLAAVGTGLVGMVYGTREETGPRPVPTWTGPAAPPPRNPQTPNASPPPSSGPPPAPSSAPVPPGLRIELVGASYHAPAPWEIYRDDRVEDGRRLVAVREARTDLRLQTVTLALEESAAASCDALVAAQSADYESATSWLPADVGVDPALGNAATCGFDGISPSDKGLKQVTFTVLRRASDNTSLVLRTTIPHATPAEAPARNDLRAMTCEASTTFGVALPLC